MKQVSEEMSEGTEGPLGCYQSVDNKNVFVVYLFRYLQSFIIHRKRTYSRRPDHPDLIQ